MGVALAKVYKYKPESVTVKKTYYGPEEKQENIDAIWDALVQARVGLSGLYSRLFAEDEVQAEIFAAHACILEDEELLMKVLHAVEADGFTAEYAIEKVFGEYIAAFSQFEERMLCDKVQDLEDVKGYLLHIMQGNRKEELAKIKEEVVLVAKGLLPSEILQLDSNYIKGIITETGSSWSHAAILAGARQIPMITGAEGIWDRLTGEEILGLDAKKGIWRINPDPVERELFLKNDAEVCVMDKTVILQDGRRIAIGINVDSPEWEAPSACYDYVGLYRTEFQYIENVQLPIEEELFETYKKVVIRANGKIVTFRTIDIGGDKLPKYIVKFHNFVEGARGVKFCFANPSIFLTQLRAILRASVYGPVQIMFPMVESVEDIASAKMYLKRAMQQLEQIEESYDRNIPVGIMIETPGILAEIERAVQAVDFASVGTNDLAAAVCKGIGMEPLYKLLEDVFEHFHMNGKEITVCGELAANPEHAKRLVELGATGLSMNWSSISEVKTALCQIGQK